MTADELVARWLWEEAGEAYDAPDENDPYWFAAAGRLVAALGIEQIGWFIPEGEESNLAMIDTEPYYGDERDVRVYRLKGTE